MIKRKNVANQLKEDLIGKDSYRGITLTYAWLANQFGHIALGFIPAFFLYDNLKSIKTYENPFFSSLIVFVFWFFFELYNFLGPLLTNKLSLTRIFFIPKKEGYVFKPRWLNIAYDTLTDVCFFGIGAFIFSFYINGLKDNLSLFILLFLMMYLIFASRYWFLTKMYQHHANYPFQFRLSQWEFDICKENKRKIVNFIKSETNGNHLLIYGSQYSGKTSLGVGILNELSIKHKVCLYTSAMKLYTYFFIEDSILFKPKKIWTWKDTDYLMIDDINPGSPIKEDFVDSKKFIKFLDPTEKGVVNEFSSKTLVTKNIIWILGNYDKKLSRWENMLIEIGVAQDKLSIINLG